MKLTDFLSDVGRPVAYYPKLAKIFGGIREAIFLCQFIYWRGKESDKKNGWIYKTQEEIEEETGLNPHEQREVRLSLKKINVLHEKKVGLPARNYYLFDWALINTIFNQHLNPTISSDANVEKTVEIYKSRLKELSLLGYRRALKSGVETEMVDYETSFIHSQGICHLCLRPIVLGVGQKGGSLQFDHVIPISKGGSHTFNNVKPSHAVCNARKKNGITDFSNSEATGSSDSPSSSHSESEPLDEQSLNHIHTENTSESTSEKYSPPKGSPKEDRAIAQEEKPEEPPKSSPSIFDLLEIEREKLRQRKAQGLPMCDDIPYSPPPMHEHDDPIVVRREPPEPGPVHIKNIIPDVMAKIKADYERNKRGDHK